MYDIRWSIASIALVAAAGFGTAFCGFQMTVGKSLIATVAAVSIIPIALCLAAVVVGVVVGFVCWAALLGGCWLVHFIYKIS